MITSDARKRDHVHSIAVNDGDGRKERRGRQEGKTGGGERRGREEGNTGGGERGEREEEEMRGKEEGKRGGGKRRGERRKGREEGNTGRDSRKSVTWSAIPSASLVSLMLNLKLVWW